MILIPIKDFATAKQRLAEVLSEAQRSELARAMFADVLAVLTSVPERPAIAVVTRDAEALAMAHRSGCQAIHDRENAGETEAIVAATEVAMARGAQFTLVIPGDAPLVKTEEISLLLSSAPSEGSVLAPAADGEGTNAVLRRPGALFPLRFGNHSFAPHLRAAHATGKAVVVLRLPGLALDIDRPADLATLAAAPGNTRAQQLVREWKVAERVGKPAGGITPEPSPATAPVEPR